ncbi:ABC transporter substrate-binding protein [Nocardiopsis nanhaiensis]
MDKRLTLIGIPLAAALLTACGGSDPFEEGADGDDEAAEGAVVVGSADFPESALLAELYGRAMEAEGVEVEYQLNIGSREVYYDQIESGALSVFPEYNGGILFYLDSDAVIGTSEETNAAIEEALPDNLEILESSSAENKDSVTVTQETADEYGLTDIGDLADVADDMALGAPAEFETRPQGVPGLESTYGVEFGDFRSLEAALIAQSLADGDIQAGNLFTTDPVIAVEDLVILDDPENLFGAQNVTPLIDGDQVDETAREALDTVSGALTTEELTELNERVIIDDENPADVAQEWLEEQGMAS